MRVMREDIRLCFELSFESILLQTILADILIRAVISITITSILLIIGAHAEFSSDALKRDVLKLPLLKSDDDNSEHRSTVLKMQRKSEILLLVWGITFVPAFPGVFLSTGILGNNIIDLLFFMLTIIIIGLPSGIGRILWNRPFWAEQLNPVMGIESRLEKYLAAQVRSCPESRPSRKWYPEVDMNIQTSYETMMRASLRQILVQMIYERHPTPEERLMILDHLSRREDLIGYIAHDIKRSIPLRAIVTP